MNIKIVCYLVIISFLVTPARAEELKPIKLADPQFDRGRLLMQALKERESTRSFSTKELPLELLSNLLWAASGINRPDSGKMTAPTAVNWQEIDIYVATKDGLYIYNRRQNMLDPVMAKDIRASVGVQDFTQVAPVNLIFVSDFSKISAGDEDKVFYSATDTGFISQNVYLFCASERLATVVLGWVDKPALAKIMKLRGDQKIILAQPVGYPE
jgi:nitroreductase